MREASGLMDRRKTIVGCDVEESPFNDRRSLLLHKRSDIRCQWFWTTFLGTNAPREKTIVCLLKKKLKINNFLRIECYDQRSFQSVVFTTLNP